MIRIRKLPFSVNPYTEFNSESSRMLTNYQIPTVDEIFYQTGNAIRFEGDWDKYQISINIGEVILDHYLLTNMGHKPIGQFPLYPVLTLVHPKYTKSFKSLPVIHKHGIQKIYSILKPGKFPYNMNFLAEYILEYIVHELDLLTFGPLCTDDDLMGVIENQIHAMHYAHNENQEDLLNLVNPMIQELLNVFHATTRNTDFPSKAMIEEILQPLFPVIPIEMDIHPISNKILVQDSLSDKEITEILRRNTVELDSSHLLDDLMLKRMDMADFDGEDIGYYPELLKIYQILVAAGYTDMFLEYALINNEWVPTPQCELYNEYRSDQSDKEHEHALILELEDLFITGQFLKDICDDLISTEENEYSPSPEDERFGEIIKIEIIVRDGAACITVYSWGLSCTTYIDYVVAAIISNSLISN